MDPQECSRIVLGWSGDGLIEMGRLIKGDSGALESVDVPSDVPELC
jgi:hypothetical protein